MYKFKMVIADDEPVIRKNLSDLLVRKFEDIECVALCGNGEQVIKALKGGNVDIVITDIQMPGTTGLDVAEYIHDNKLHAKVILVTGYSEFEYARKAINYGVEQFLLKPINFTELIGAVEKIKNEMSSIASELQSQSKNQLQLRLMMRNYISLYLWGVIPYERLCELNFANMELFDYKACVMATLDTTENSAEARDIDKWIDICEIQNADINCFCINEVENHIGLLFFVYSEDIEVGKQKVSEHLEECRRLMKGAHNIDFSYETKYSEKLENSNFINFDELSKLYIKHLTGFNSAANEEIFNIVISTMSMHNVRRFFETVVNKLAKTYPLENEQLICEINSISSSEDAAQFAKIFNNSFKEALQGKDMISKVILYVNEHFCDKSLDLNHIANQFHFNRSYLSRIFKQQTGQNPSDYIFNLRINKSKELLKSRKYTVKKVAEMVGYSDEKHFGQAFKRATGLTPSNFMHVGD
ncbi:MAG: response regulator [Clostridia bacterium]|nr:response regulator [Clostridia bacterium]